MSTPETQIQKGTKALDQLETYEASWRFRHRVCFFLTLLCFICMLGIIITACAVEGFTKNMILAAFMPFLAPSYLGYLFNCFLFWTPNIYKSSTRIRSFDQFLSELRSTSTNLTISVHCYSTKLVTIYHNYTDSNGGTYTTTSTSKETHADYSETFTFTPSKCEDLSHTPSYLNRPFTQVQFVKYVTTGDEYTNNFIESKKEELYQANRHRGERCNTEAELQIPNFIENAIVNCDEKLIPWWANRCVYFLCSIFLLSWPYRVLFDKFIGPVQTYYVKKSIYFTPIVIEVPEP